MVENAIDTCVGVVFALPLDSFDVGFSLLSWSKKLFSEMPDDTIEIAVGNQRRNRTRYSLKNPNGWNRKRFDTPTCYFGNTHIHTLKIILSKLK